MQKIHSFWRKLSQCCLNKLLSYFTCLVLSVIWLPYVQVWAVTEDRGDSITHPMVINYWLKGDRELRNKVRSLGPAECLAGIEPGTFQFLCNALIHQATLRSKAYERNFMPYTGRYFKGCYREEYTKINFHK